MFLAHLVQICHFEHRLGFDVQGRCETASQGEKTKKNNIDFGGGGLKSKIIDIVDLSTYILSEIVDNVRR